MSMTLREARRWGTSQLEKAHISTTSALDALLLLCHVAQISKERFYLDDQAVLSEGELAEYQALIERCSLGEPVAYLTNTKEFYGLPFYVDSRVLVPRPESELLVSLGLTFLQTVSVRPKLLDLCTGSGAVGLAIAAHQQELYLTLADLSSEALTVARRNADQLIDAPITIVESDLFSELTGERFDLIVANPPYLTHTWVQETSPQVQREPRSALLGGGVDGLDVLRRLISAAPQHLAEKGALMIECDTRQIEAVKELFYRSGLVEVQDHNDLSGKARVVTGRVACTKN